MRSKRIACLQGRVWEVDHTGFPQMLELDDWEVTVLCAWVKTGHWLRPEARQYLDISLAPSGCEATQVNVQLQGGKVQLAITLCERTSAPNEVVLSAYGDKERWMLHEWRVSKFTPPCVPPGVSLRSTTQAWARDFRRLASVWSSLPGLSTIRPQAGSTRSLHVGGCRLSLHPYRQSLTLYRRVGIRVDKPLPTAYAWRLCRSRRGALARSLFTMPAPPPGAADSASPPSRASLFVSCSVSWLVSNVLAQGCA